MAPKSTKERILDAAEELFAEHGFAAASMRAITAEADVNLASVNYHFGSKEALVEAVFARRLKPLNRERLERLDALEAEAGDRPPAVEAIVEAFVGPALRLRRARARGWSVFRRLLGHTISLPDGKIREMFTHQFDEVVRRFTAALGRACPALPPDEVFWRLLFMIGAMAHTMAMADDLSRISRGTCDGKDVDGAIRRLVPFLAAGFRADVPSDAERRRTDAR